MSSSQQQLQQSSSAEGAGRRMSFTSSSMAFGAWPENINMADPIINVVILLEELPEMEEVHRMVDVVLKYERMSGGTLYYSSVVCVHCCCCFCWNQHVYSFRVLTKFHLIFTTPHLTKTTYMQYRLEHQERRIGRYKHYQHLSIQRS